MRRETMARLGFMAPGPFRANQLRPGDPYELSSGHPILVFPKGVRGGRAKLVGAAVLDSDPEAEGVAINAGFTPDPMTLRAPDISIGDFPDTPGWTEGTPALAVEYVEVGDNEDYLQAKIEDLLDAGTQLIWIVRLGEPTRVEVHQTGKPTSLVLPGQTLAAPGLLKNTLRVEALYDSEAAHEATLLNLLNRKGYTNLEAFLAAQRGQS